MARERSPNYPQIGLGEAVGLLRKFYEAEGRTSVDNDTAAKAIGYNVISGASRTKIGAMKQFGLLHGRGNTIAITPLGLRVLHPDDDIEYMSALREAAHSPDMFGSLLDSHTEASDNAIVSFAVKNRSFTQEGARQLAKSFRETLAFAKLTGKPHNNEEAREENVARKDPEMQQNEQPTAQLPVPTDAGVSFNVPYRGATLSVRVEVKGQPLGRAHVEKVVRYLKLVAEDFPDVEVASPTPASLNELSDEPQED